MDSTLLDQLEIDVKGFLGDSQEAGAPENKATFEAKFTDKLVSNSASALLQVSIAQGGTDTAKFTAILKLLKTKFSNLAILIDMELATLVYSIILPYMPKDKIKEIIKKRKVTWVTDHIAAINDTSLTWTMIIDEDESILPQKQNNITKLKKLLKNDMTFASMLNKDAELFKQFLLDSHSITPACYLQSQEKNDKAIEDYLISRLATAEALHNFNRDKYDYIALNHMHSYSYLQQEALPNLPKCLTVDVSQVAESQDPLPTSTEVNQNLHDLNLLDKITERRSYLEQSAKHFPGHVYIESLNRTFLAFNKQQCLSFGVDDESYFVGKSFEDVISQDDVETISKTIDEVASENKAKILVESTTYLGEVKKYLNIKTPLRNKRNKTIGIIGFTIKLEDNDKYAQMKNLAPEKIMQALVAEDKHSNQNTSSHSNIDMKEVIQDMPGHVLWQGTDGKIVCTNDYQAVFLGFKSPDELIGKPLSQFLIEKHAKAAKQHINEIVKTGAPLIAEEIYKTPDGFVAMNSHKTPVNDDSGKVIGIMTVSFDISRSKQRELRLEREKAKLEEEDKFKRKFIQELESELRAPFTEICNLTEACVEAEDDFDRKLELNEISNCAKDLLRYCNSLLEFSNDKSFGMRKDTIVLREFIDSITNTSIVAIKAKQLEFKLDFDNRLPETVIGDSYRLSRILSNLINNATKFTASGYIKLAVKLKSAEQNNITILFTVTDTGIGISKEKQNKVFNKYSMLDQNNYDLATGQGLGLSEVKRLTEDLEGKISLESEEHKGTSIMVKLTFLLSEES